MFDIKKDLLETHEALLNVTIDEQTVKKAMQNAARQISRQINIPGFRKGRAPYARVLRYVGEPAVLQEASDALLEELYPQIIETAEISPYGPGQLEDVQHNPLTFVIRIPLAPIAELGDYQDLRADWEQAAVTEEEITAIADQIREENAVLELQERSAQYGDEVHIDVTGTIDDEVVIDEEDVEVVLSEETPFITPEFVEGLLGMSAGEEKAITVTFPEDFADVTFQGQEVRFDVKAISVYERSLPEFDDALASTVGSFETIDVLKQDIRDRLMEAKVQQGQDAYRDGLVEALIEQSEVKYPPAMLEETLNDMIESTGQRVRRERNMSLEDALQLDGMTLAQFRENARPQAEARIKRSVVLSEFAKLEGIEVSNDEVVQEYNNLFTAYGGPDVEIPEMNIDLDSQLGQNLRLTALGRKTLERLEKIGRGLGDIEDAADEAAAEDVAEEAVVEEEAATEGAVVEAVEATLTEDEAVEGNAEEETPEVETEAAADETAVAEEESPETSEA